MKRDTSPVFASFADRQTAKLSGKGKIHCENPLVLSSIFIVFKFILKPSLPYMTAT